jgi:hypothetical protein
LVGGIDCVSRFDLGGDLKEDVASDGSHPDPPVTVFTRCPVPAGLGSPVGADTGRPGGLRFTLAVVTCGSELGTDMMSSVLDASGRCDSTGVGWAMCREPLFARTGTVI